MKNSGRKAREITVTTLENIDYEAIDMLTIVIVGNSKTYIDGKRIITPRGYKI